MALVKKILFAVTLVVVFSVFAIGQDLTFREATGGIARNDGSIYGPPHACTVSKSHPCVYYGGDIDPSDPEFNGLSNENTLFIPNSYTYTEVSVPIAASISASFSNNFSTYGVIDPKTATWFYRTGVSEGNGGTLICSGDNPGMLTPIPNFGLSIDADEVLTTTPCKVPAGDVWFAVTPNCTNPNDVYCTSEESPRYFEEDTDGKLNGINTKFTVTSNDGMGPTFDSAYFGVSFGSWCNDEGVACGDGMSAGVLK
jgi:hypothetical protein